VSIKKTGPRSEEKMPGLFRSVGTIGGVTIISRITGFIRDMLVALCMGANALTDAFFVAFKLTNVLRRLFAEGAFNASFLPVFSRVLVRNGKEKAQELASQTLTVLIIFLSGFSVFVILGYADVIRGLAPGFAPDGKTFKTAVLLGRICFPYLTVTSIMALFCGILNTFNKFALPAATQILLNLFFIFVLITGIALHCQISTIALMLALSTLAAGLMQVTLVWWAVERLSIRVRFVRPKMPKELREIGRKMVPGILGAGVWQINLLVDTQACSFLTEGAVSYIYFADRVNQLPLGTLGIALSTVLLPTLSKLIQGGRQEQATIEFNRGVSLAFFLTIPAAVCMVMIPHILVALVYERGSFLSHQVAPVADALRAFGWGVPAYIGTKILASAFFAQGDTRTPVKVGLVSVLANISFIVLLTPKMGHVGIALATALSSWVNVSTLYILLRRKALIFVFPKTQWRCAKQLIAACIVAIEMFIFNVSFGQDFIDGALSARILLFLAIIGIALGTYGGVTYVIKAFPALGPRPQGAK
jgi:putative peptidoglycan lipid II flippase